MLSDVILEWGHVCGGQVEPGAQVSDVVSPSVVLVGGVDVDFGYDRWGDLGVGEWAAAARGVRTRQRAGVAARMLHP